MKPVEKEPLRKEIRKERRKTMHKKQERQVLTKMREKIKRLEIITEAHRQHIAPIGVPLCNHGKIFDPECASCWSEHYRQYMSQMIREIKG